MSGGGAWSTEPTCRQADHTLNSCSQALQPSHFPTISLSLFLPLSLMDTHTHTHTHSHTHTHTDAHALWEPRWAFQLLHVCPKEPVFQSWLSLVSTPGGVSLGHSGLLLGLF